MERSERLARQGVRWGLALAVAAGAFGVRLLLPADYGRLVSLFGLAVVLAALAGAGPGLLATALVALGLSGPVLPPGMRLDLSTLADRIRLAFVVCTGVLASAIGGRAAGAVERVTRRLVLQARVLEHVSEAVVAVDARERVTFWSRGAERTYGVAEADALGRDVREAFRWQWRSPREKEEVLAALGRDGWWRGENVHVLRDGRELVVESAITVLQGAGRDRWLLAVMRDVTARRRLEASLEESREQLRALAQQLRTSREEEQVRIARDLHDDLGQALTALKMQLRSLERVADGPPGAEAPGRLLDGLVAASALADDTMAAVQRIALDLRSGALDLLGIAAAVREEARRFQARTGLACRAEVEGELPALRPAAATALYRICQEALTNVSRHAGAAAVVIRLRAAGDQLELTVEDDGRGIDPAAAASPAALGLLGMAERARAAGGTLSVAPGPRGGTVVSARVRCDAA